MGALEDRRRLEELYLPPSDEFAVVEVPDLQFVMIDGEGDHEGEAFAHAFRWLFSAIAPIKRVAKERMGKSFAEPPPECLWWADDMADFIAGNREKISNPGHAGPIPSPSVSVRADPRWARVADPAGRFVCPGA